MKLSIMPALAFSASAALVCAAILSVSQAAIPAPPPKAEAPQISVARETVVLAGGSFWGMQAVYQHVKGVSQAVAGYAGGDVADPTYDQVSDGRTGHAQAVAVTFDPTAIRLGDILRIYFSVAHNPTEIDRQGPDEGSQYRSEIFVSDPAQGKFAKDYIAQLDAARIFGRPIVTRVQALATFYPAESYHQNYAARHPGEPYVAYVDEPKVENLKRLYPTYYRETPKLLTE